MSICSQRITRLYAPGMALLLALASGCADDVDEPEVMALTEAALSEVRPVVPSVGLPAEVTLQASNNNLDVIRHDGRVWLAFRTNKSHFAGTGTLLYVVSSKDETTWRYEWQTSLGTDLREPRWFSWKGRLWLYYAVLGSNRLDFEPQGTLAVERLVDGTWTAPQAVLDQGFIPWRMRIVDGVPIMIGYTGGDEVYDGSDKPAIAIKLLTTTDGWTWTALVKGKGTVHSGGGSESDFAIPPDGSLVAVVRNEAGDEGGFGSKVCTAPAGAWADWTCNHDPRRYDSPLLLQVQDRTWLFGRRNVSDDGHFDLGETGKHSDLYKKYQLAYWTKPKRCALWQVHPATRKVEFVLDLPSKGDTCFVSTIDLPTRPGAAASVAVYNYTSPLDGPDVSWFEGQTGTTSIHRVALDLPQ